VALETARIGTFPGYLDLNEADQRLAEGDGIVGPREDVRQARLADHRDGFLRIA
jgi:hypothetical protein